MLYTGIVVVYLVISIIIGIYYGSKVKTIKDFTVGNKDFSTFLLASTTFSTLIDNNSIFSITTMLKISVVYSITLLAQLIGLSSYCLFFIERIQRKFKNAISIGEIMNTFYGREAAIISGITGTIFSVIIIALQLKIMEMIFHHFFDIDFTVSLVFSALVLLSYTIFGGAKVVLMSDLLQFIVIMVTMCYLFIAAPQINTSFINVFKTYEALNVNFFYHDINNYLVIFISNAIPIFHPPIIQRILMIKNVSKAIRTFGIVAVMIIPF